MISSKKLQNFNASDVTIYVPYFNNEETIGNCIRGLQNLTKPPAKIIIINDGSKSPKEFLSKPEEVVDHDTNQGLASARNTALNICKTPLIASVDADVIVEATWLEKMIDMIRSFDVVGVGGRLNEGFKEKICDRWRATHMLQNWGDSIVFNPRFLYGANTLFYTDSLRQVGGYNKLLKTNDEDRTICELIYENGKNLVYTPFAKMYALPTRLVENNFKQLLALAPLPRVITRGLSINGRTDSTNQTGKFRNL